MESVHEIFPDDFSILQSAKDHELKIAESINIHKIRPNLNEMVSSSPLFILN